MDRMIYIAMTGAKHTLGQQAAVSHNLANVDSTGFRSEMHRLRAVDVKSEALPSRAFVVDASVATDFTPGPLQYTGRAHDVAIEGRGWFVVQTPEGEAYTRNGGFQVSANGILQTHDGRPVLGNAGPIVIPPDSEVSIGKDGSISIIDPAALEMVNVMDRLRLVNPPEEQLTRGEDGLFRLAPGQVAPRDDMVQVAGGYTEGSNVNPAEQLIQMISLTRQFEMQTRMLQNAETNDRAAAQLLSRS